jgi:hypothetical protein
MKLLRLTCLFFAASASAALAHGAEEGFVLLLPSQHYIVGAALAVAASFLLLALLPQRWAHGMGSGKGLRLLALPGIGPTPFSLLALALLIVLVAAGIAGPRDPMKNPFPLFIWVDWWIAFTLLQAITGNLWTLFNPWTGLIDVLRAIFGRFLPEGGFVRLPQQLGHAIAILQFFGFAWYELVDLAPYDPDRLAYAVIAFYLFNLGGMVVFGREDWSRRAEPFSIYFSLIGGLAPLQPIPDGTTGRQALHLVWPGMRMSTWPPLPLTGIAFVLLTLATVSFDGLSHTYSWATLIGLNPLEFPGRSAVVWQSTAGLFGAFAALGLLFAACVWAGLKLSGGGAGLGEASGRLIYSIVPISLAFHAAHYLTFLMVEGQYAVIAASDPFGLGWNLFGTAGWQVTTSFFFNYESVLAIWNIQTAVIVIGHVIGIVMAHVIAVSLFPRNSAAVRSQLTLAVFMVLYTAFGLWLLATPSMG